MMTNEEARAAVEAELFALKLTQRMTLPEKTAFCESAHRRLLFQSDTDRLREIIVWVETWQSLWLPDKPTSGGNADLRIGGTLDTVEPRFRLLSPTSAGTVSRTVLAWRAVVMSYSPRDVLLCHRMRTNVKNSGADLLKRLVRAFGDLAAPALR